MALAEQKHEQQPSLSSPGGVDGVGINNCGVDEPGKAPRLPRWTRQEILVLIQGKRVAENRVRRGRTSGLAFGSVQVEPKWASVSSYCKRHGVNRGPVQCRKRWSNLAGDFKKIKEWESQIKDESESYWVMRNDLRRERKLPGFFDKEVFDILDGAPVPGPGPGPVVSVEEKAKDQEQDQDQEKDDDHHDGGEEEEEEEEEQVEGEAVFDSGRSAAADDGLFSDFEQSGPDEMGMGRTPDNKDPPSAIPIPAPIPISEKQYQPVIEVGTGPGTSEKQPVMNPEMGSTSHERRKRRRFMGEDDNDGASLQDQLIEVLERNGRILSTQLEAQNFNQKLDREERKDYASSLVTVLNKLADALGRIADKL